MVVKLWGISDGRTGHMAQLEGVHQALLNLLGGDLKWQSYVLTPSFLGKFGSSLWPLGLQRQLKKELLRGLKANLPAALVVIGRRNLSATLYLQRYVQKVYQVRLKLIFLMPPSSNPGVLSKLDLTFAHAYKYAARKAGFRAAPKGGIFTKSQKAPNLSAVGGVVELIPFPPSGKPVVDSCVSSVVRNPQGNRDLESPLIGVLVGGKAKGVTWNQAAAQELCAQVAKLADALGGRLAVVCSRRTGGLASYIKEVLQNKAELIYDMTSEEPNAYQQILQESDYLVVTLESASMIADCVSARGKGSAAVFIYDSSKLGGKRFRALADFCYEHNYARSLSKVLEQLSPGASKSNPELAPTKMLPNTAQLVATEILKVLKPTS